MSNPLKPNLVSTSKKMRRSEGSKNKAREAIAGFIDENVDRLQEWLDDIAFREGPKSAMGCFLELLEYHVPKLSRTEMTGADNGPVKLVIQWDDGEEPRPILDVTNYTTTNEGTETKN